MNNTNQPAHTNRYGGIPCPYCQKEFGTIHLLQLHEARCPMLPPERARHSNAYARAEFLVLVASGAKDVREGWNDGV